MKCHLSVLFLIFICVCLDSGLAEDDEPQFDENIWTSFKVRHNKTYDNQKEDRDRLKYFKRQVNFVNAHNELHKEGKVPFTLTVYEFADLSREEILEKRTGLKLSKLYDINYEKKHLLKTAVNDADVEQDAVLEKSIIQNDDDDGDANSFDIPIEGSGVEEKPEARSESDGIEEVEAEIDSNMSFDEFVTTIGTTKRPRRTRSRRTTVAITAGENLASETTVRTTRSRRTTTRKPNDAFGDDVTKSTKPSRTRKTRTTPVRSRRTRATTTTTTTTTQAPTNPTVMNGFSWTDTKKVTPVKDQKNCGSCWSFAVAAAIESQLLIKGKGTFDLAEQNIVDCDKEEWGCNGGDPFAAMDWLKKSGVTIEANYPYKAKNGLCKKNVLWEKFNTIGQTANYQLDGDENALKDLIDKSGPAVVGIHASNYFLAYKSGILVDTTCNYAVLVVGYGTDNSGKDYWLVKNSWGTSWGENGYIRMARNKDNMCGIAYFGSVPSIA